MQYLLKTTSTLALGLGCAAIAVAQEPKDPVPFPDPQSLASEDAKLVPHDQLMHTEKLPHYQEPGWITELVEAGKLPPVEERLPVEPMVVDTKSTPDGPGVYGGVTTISSTPRCLRAPSLAFSVMAQRSRRSMTAPSAGLFPKPFRSPISAKWPISISALDRRTS